MIVHVTDIGHVCFTSPYRELEGQDCLAKVADQEGLVKLAQDIGHTDKRNLLR